MELPDFRKEYSKFNLRRSHLSLNPFKQFRLWFDEAVEKKVLEPEAMQLATCYNDQPSLRTVLLKGFENDTFRFFTNYESRKAKELSLNPRASLIFYWKEIEKQVVIEGLIQKTSKEISEA